MNIADRHFVLEELTAANASRERLDAAAAEIFGVFLEREKSFSFNPDVTIDYPDVGQPDCPFLSGPLRYLAGLRDAAKIEGAPFGRVVILTTYADRIHDALVAEGYQAHKIDMPAGPDHTFAYIRDIDDAPQSGRILYLEAVNEADEKIRPSFAIRLLDEAGALLGGACGSVHDRDGRRYAYLATLTIAAGLPPTTGTRLAQAMFDLLRREGVSVIHLGTQTAAPFYEKLGFETTLHLIPDLRSRTTDDGRRVTHDLVMMALDLPPA